MDKNFNYHYSGRETVDFNLKKNTTSIFWDDGTETTAKLNHNDEFDYEFGMLVCVAKKFIKGLSLDTLYKVTKDNKGFKEVLKMMLRNTKGYDAYLDIKYFANSYKKFYKEQVDYENRVRKNRKRRHERFLKIEKLKKEGKWVEKNTQPNLENNTENQLVKKLLEENARLKTQLLELNN